MSTVLWCALVWTGMKVWCLSCREFHKGGAVDSLRKHFSVYSLRGRGWHFNKAEPQLPAVASFSCLELRSSNWKLQGSYVTSFLVHFWSRLKEQWLFPSSSHVRQSMTSFPPSALPLLSAGSCVYQSKFSIVMHIISILTYCIAYIYFLKIDYTVTWKDSSSHHPVPFHQCFQFLDCFMLKQ